MIEDAYESGDIGRAKQLTRDLIELQKQIPVLEPDLEILERTHGIKRRVIEIEKQLVEEIRQCEHNGDMDTARQLREKLIHIQKHDQPQVGIKL